MKEAWDGKSDHLPEILGHQRRRKAWPGAMSDSTSQPAEHLDPVQSLVPSAGPGKVHFAMRRVGATRLLQLLSWSTRSLTVPNSGVETLQGSLWSPVAEQAYVVANAALLLLQGVSKKGDLRGQGLTSTMHAAFPRRSQSWGLDDGNISGGVHPWAGSCTPTPTPSPNVFLLRLEKHEPHLCLRSSLLQPHLRGNRPVPAAPWTFWGGGWGWTLRW